MLAVPAAALMLGAAQAGTTVGLNFQSYYYDSGATPQTVGFGAGYQTTGVPVTAKAFGVEVADWTNSDPLPAQSSFTTAVPFGGGLSANVTASNTWESGLTAPGVWGLQPGVDWYTNWADGAAVLAAITPGNYQVAWSFLDNTGWSMDITGLNAKFPNGYVLGLVGGNKTTTTSSVAVTETAGSSLLATVTFSVLPDNLGIGATPALTNDAITLTNLSRPSNTNCALAGLIVTDKPVVTQDPTGGTFASGSDINLSAKEIGLSAGLHYQWKKNGVDIGGANGLTYTKAQCNNSDNGNYTIVVTNDYGSVTSASATVSVTSNTWNPPVTIAGDSDVTTSGSLVFAYDWNSSATSVNGVAFTAPGSGVSLTGFYGNYGSFLNGTGAPATSLSTEYKNILTGGQYTNGVAAATLTLNALTVGHQYLAQFWVDDSRNDSQNRVETLTSGTNTVTLAYPANSVGALGQYTIGTFVATATTKVINLLGSHSTQVNALQLRDLGIPPVVPAPAFTPVAGIYLGGSLAVSLTSSGTIHYTTNGTTPTSSSPVYSGPITVPTDSTMTITAYAVAAGQADSEVVSSTYHTYSSPLVPTWTNAAGGSWADPANWAHALVASGSGVTAAFDTLNLSADASVTLDGAHTIGQLVFGDTTPDHNWILNTGSAGVLTLDATGTPTITVANPTTTINAVLAGSKGFSKLGSGTLVLAGSSNYSGTTTVNAGLLEVQARNGDVPYAVSATATLMLGYSTGGGYSSTNMLVHGNGTAATTGLYLKGGTSYNCSGTLELLDAPTTIRQYGTGLASLNIFDVNSTGLWVAASASGSVIDANIQMVKGGYGMSSQIDAGANTATGDLVINGPLNVTSLGFFKRGAGSLVLNGVANNGNLALHIEGGSVVCGVADCIGANADLLMSGGTTLALNGLSQTVKSVITTGTIKLAAPGTDILHVTNNLNVTGATLNFALTGTLTAPAYVIATYGTLTGSFANVLNLPAGYLISYSYAGNQIALLDSSVAPRTVWTGAISGDWDIATTSNWLVAGSAAMYAEGEIASFDDSSVTQTIALDVTVHPLLVHFNNVTKDYILGGVGGIAGATGLTKDGAGALTLTDYNIYTGATTITAGTVNVGDGDTLGTLGGAGNITLNAGAVLSFNGWDTLTLSRSIVGTGGSLIKTSTGSLTLNAPNNTCDITVNGGTFYARGGGWSTAFAAGKLITVGPDGTLNTSIHSMGSSVGGGGDVPRVALNGGNWILNGEQYIRTLTMTAGTTSGVYGMDGLRSLSGAVYTSAAAATSSTIGSPLTLVNNLTLLVYDGEAADDLVISGVISNSGSLTKTGDGLLRMTGANTYTGVTTVNGGTLAVNGTSIPDANKLVIVSGKVDLTGTETVGTLFFGSAQQVAGTWGASGSGATHIDDTRFSGSGLLDVAHGADYSSWASINAPGQTASQDYDHDGVANGIEYFMGQSGSGFTALPGVVETAGVRSVTWTKGAAYTGVYGVDYFVQTSTDLATWTNATIGAGAGHVTDGSSSVEFTLPAGATVFTRLMVTGP